jgi:5-formyltetrahydrofolate cyclo-ligase
VSIQDEKSRLRLRMLSLRKGINKPELALLLKQVFLCEDSFSCFQKIAAYWPMAGELDVVALMQSLWERGQSCALPVVVKKKAPLSFRKWEPGDKLIAGPHGTLHPSEQALLIVPDLVLVPLLAFDRTGGRLGFGGGYYDRTLVALPPVCKVGVAFDEQEVDLVPTDHLDQRMDWIVTPTRVIQIKE